MAKKKKDVFDLDFLLNDLPAAPSRRDQQFDDPFAGVTRQDIHEVTNASSAMHGKDAQLTFRLSPAVVEEIRDWSGRLKLTQADVKRWLVARGLRALREGERPETEVVEVVRVKADL